LLRPGTPSLVNIEHGMHLERAAVDRPQVHLGRARRAATPARPRVYNRQPRGGLGADRFSGLQAQHSGHVGIRVLGRLDRWDGDPGRLWPVQFGVRSNHSHEQGKRVRGGAAAAFRARCCRCRCCCRRWGYGCPRSSRMALGGASPSATSPCGRSRPAPSTPTRPSVEAATRPTCTPTRTSSRSSTVRRGWSWCSSGRLRREWCR